MKSITVSMAAAVGLAIAGSALAAAMPAEVKELKCLYCHAVDHKVIGPAWRDVGKKYKGDQHFEYNGKEYPLLEGLVMKVSKGSKAGEGHWGTMPMPAEDPIGTKKDKIEKIVKFALSLG
jgi:cytochrome c551/c552